MLAVARVFTPSVAVPSGTKGDRGAFGEKLPQPPEGLEQISAGLCAQIPLGLPLLSADGTEDCSVWEQHPLP